MSRFDFPTDDGTISVMHWADTQSAMPDGQKPILHWAHANGFNAQTYDKLLAPLAAHIDIFAADARGHGLTDLPCDPHRMTGWHIYCDDMVPLVEKLAAQAGAKIWLGGHSMGGCVSVLLAAKRPDLVAGLVLADPVIVPYRPRWMMRLYGFLKPTSHIAALTQMSAKRRRDWPDAATIEAAYAGRGAFATWQAGFLPDYLAGGLHPITEDEQGNKVRLACAPQWEAANFLGPQINAAKAVKKLQTPFTLLMAQTASTTRVVSDFEKLRVDKKIEIVPDTTHFLPMENPKKLRAEICARLGITL